MDDTTVLHEAMEQQTISISKSTVHTTLITTCGVIAAMNPTKGHYDINISFKNNVLLADSLISRFDLICIIKDDTNTDADIANFVLQSHQDNHPDVPSKQQTYISSEFLRKYINYAKYNCHPLIPVCYTCFKKVVLHCFFRLLLSSTSGNFILHYVKMRIIQKVCR